ncbi:MAG: DNA cytosine methyltransferase [Pseudomonadota bacterium]|nr:DNA cytosine methyltransferase [Pseudomonadota bacterium]
MPAIEAVDLFCGVGGLTCGLRSAGVQVRAGYDIDPACKYPYESNNGATFVTQSVSELSGADLASWYSPGAICLLAGCAPCQPFSTLANVCEKKDETKWGLLEEFARLVRELKPELVTMENVPRVTNHAPYRSFVETLETLGYHVSSRRARCADYGIPQERRRFVLVASRLGPVRIPPPSGPVRTVREAIGHLPKLAAGQADATDPLHKARNLNLVNLRRIRASRPGGTWEDWPEELRAPCHLASTGASFKSVYARMSWDQPAPTMTTQCYNFGTGRFGHPEQDRGITLREAAIIQSFPDDYRFVPPGEIAHFASVGRMIGNAVPPRLGELVGKIFMDHVNVSIG